MQASSAGSTIVTENTGAAEFVNTIRYVVLIRNSKIITEKLTLLADDKLLNKFSISENFQKSYIMNMCPNLTLVEKFIKKN